MKYIVSDIHGNKEKFKKLLTSPHLKNPTTELYILGDVIDRGKQGIELLYMISNLMQHNNVKLIKGNHELFLQLHLEGKLDAVKWESFGGKTTLETLSRMNNKDKEWLHDFVKELPIYIEVDDNGKKVVFTHSGIQLDYIVLNENQTINVKKSIKLATAEDEYSLLISDDIHYMPFETAQKLDEYIYCGHYPCRNINIDGSDSIYVSSFYTDIDSGCGHGGKLACLCLDNKEVRYF